MTRDPDAPWRRSRRPTPEPHVARLQARVDRGRTLAEAAEEVGIPLWLAKAVFKRSGLPLPRPTQAARARARGLRVPRTTGRRRPHRQGRPPAPELDEFGLALALRLMAHQLGAERGARGPVPVTRAEWDARRDKRIHPDAVAVTRRFGSWSAACERAGVPLRGRSSRPRWTAEDCLDAVRAFLAESPDRTASADYVAWARGREVPSLPTVAARLGSWAEAEARARG